MTSWQHNLLLNIRLYVSYVILYNTVEMYLRRCAKDHVLILRHIFLIYRHHGAWPMGGRRGHSSHTHNRRQQEAILLQRPVLHTSHFSCIILYVKTVSSSTTSTLTWYTLVKQRAERTHPHSSFTHYLQFKLITLFNTESGTGLILAKCIRSNGFLTTWFR